jgi:Fe-S oxidoreductase
MIDTESISKKYGISDGTLFVQRLNEACPVAAVNPNFSPERILVLTQEQPDELHRSPLIWECLTCGLCHELSCGRVDMSSFVRELRVQAFSGGFFPAETNGGLLLAAQRICSRPGVRQVRTGWMGKPLKVRKGKGEYLYWVGGAPFFDAALPDFGRGAIDSARSAILLMNRVGIKPVVLEEGRFSGHDLLWTGDVEGFTSLARKNIEEIERSCARVVVVSSPHDYHTLGKSYRELFGSKDFRVMHITELIAEHVDELRLKERKARVTYHDPCRLGRGMGVYDAPRKILSAIFGIELIEMPHARERALCCGTSCWTNCTQYSKLMQVNRLREAQDTGAEALITACWECELHFSCTLRPESWRQVSIAVWDLISFVASLLSE